VQDTVTRMPPGAVCDVDAHQGWALTSHPPAPAGDRSVDFLFLHGMAAGSWVWPAPWLEAFTGAGYRCWSLSLPGRDGGGQPPGDPDVIERALAHAMTTGDTDGAAMMLLRSLPGVSLFDGPTLSTYADALQEALDEIGRPVVVVGHSLGGAVVQACLRRETRPAGAVLMCSVPPYGSWRASAEMAVTNPALWQSLAMLSLFGTAAADLQIMRANLFPNGIGDRDFARMVVNMRDESLAATVQALGLLPFAPAPGPRSDVLVIGGGRDTLIPVTDTMLTGLYYGQVARILPEAGHMLMQEASAGAAVAHIFDWLGEPRA